MTFVAGTPIATPFGAIGIEYLVVGGYVWAGDGPSSAPRKIQEIVSTEARVVELDFGDDRLRCARAHPFFTGEWKDADTLKPGAKIVRRDGALQMLYAIRDVGRAKVYELSLTGLHTYFVGCYELAVRDVQRAPALRFSRGA